MISGSTDTPRSTIKGGTGGYTGFLSLRQTANFSFFTLTIIGTFCNQSLSTTLSVVRITLISSTAFAVSFMIVSYTDSITWTNHRATDIFTSFDTKRTLSASLTGSAICVTFATADNLANSG
jgi:hypothetical protein